MKDMLTQQSIDAILNPELSWGAKGLYLFMAHALPENEVQKGWLYEQSSSGRDMTTRAMRELSSHGFIKRTLYRSKKGKIKGTYWSVK